MLVTLSSLVQKHKKKLTQTDWQLFESVVNTPLETMTIQQLAKQNHVSTTTVFRFCQKLGLSGFSELKAVIKNDRVEVVPTLRLTQHYHDVVDYVQSLDLTSLKEALASTEAIFIYAHSELELRLAKEMQRIFLPLEKPIFILPNALALSSARDSLKDQLLWLFAIDTDNLPVSCHNQSALYTVLFGPIHYLPILVDQQLMIPTLSSGDGLLPMPLITSYILALELLYLKIQLDV
ncbi:MurR/RpiR family transcriptional regulator [Streptococcus sp. zg-JUN1979]|uniref:MurR/RpiR family transcriptional regulator n=1 Tax=Streptococcus sp. zg-JUN1979 TaxID=3391450 RepID=UPI0039A60A88